MALGWFLGLSGHKWNWLVLDIYFLRSPVTINISTWIQAPILENVKPPGASNTENMVYVNVCRSARLNITDPENVLTTICSFSFTQVTI